MPNFYAHLTLCRAAEAALDLPTQTHRDALYCGGFGPDPLYFYVQDTGKLRRAAVDLHHHSGRAALERFRRPIREDWPYARAFAAGYLLHFLLDARCHPFVQQVVDRGTYTHFQLEGEYDRYLIAQDGGTYPAALPPKTMPPEFYRTAAEMTPALTPRAYEKALADFRWVSLKFGGWAGKPIHRAVNGISHIPAARSLRGVILGKTPDPKLRRYFLTLDRLCRETAQAAPEIFSEFFAAAQQGRPFPACLDRDFSGNPI
jgi:hypothetical protein